VSVLQRADLEGSPLADLHAIASELGIESYRAMRKGDLVKAILDAQGVTDEPSEDRDERASSEDDDHQTDGPDRELDDEPQAKSDEPEAEPEPEVEAERITGVLDVLPNGSGFLRVGGEGQSRDDVYVSPAQIRRCELRAGDGVEGPLRPARRNERHPSLVRVEKVNGGDAEPPEQRPNFAELTAVNPTEKLPAPAAFADYPYGKGSRVAIAGAPGSGLTRLLGEALEAITSAKGDLDVAVVLVGARPEEVTAWESRDAVKVTGGSFDSSIEAQTQAADLAVERAKRTAERGGDAVVFIDSLEALPHGAARRLFGAARKLEEGGSLTVIAVVGNAPEPLRQASTRITLDAAAAEPTVLAPRSATQRSDLLS
jgi:transcription termination factor Rho